MCNYLQKLLYTRKIKEKSVSKINFLFEVNLYTYKTLITLIVCMFVCLFVCMFETVHTNPGYGMATLIYNNLLNLISGTVILLRSS